LKEDEMPEYDCTEDVKEHKRKVEYWMSYFSTQIKGRAAIHDDSKLKDPVEKAMFDKWTPELRSRDFGTEHYKAALDGMGEGIALHYKANRHHPEHYENGVDGMTIIDVIEMLADWMAAAQARDVHVDLDHAAKRFGLSDQLVQIFANTLREEDFWAELHNCPICDLCPPEYRKGHVEGFTKTEEK
jgi:hypothetical protein